MNLIASTRPKNWNSIVGQERALRILQASLLNPRFLPKGFIFEGVYGVGKTSAAYIHARALMCTGSDPLGCGQCDSCRCVDNEGIEAHPDFSEVKAAMNSSVDNARDLVSHSLSLPVLGKRRVLMMDEAHRLSRAAWDAFLSVLEQKDTDSVFLFVTNEGGSIPKTIRSRVCKARFVKVGAETILGLVMNIANTNAIDFELDALRVISRAAKGHVRNAVELLGTVAMMGQVNRETVAAAIDSSLEDYAVRILTYVVNKEQQKAVMSIDEACLSNPPATVLSALFSTYGRVVYSPDPGEENLSKMLVPVAEATTVFIKWSSAPNIPVDAMPLFIYEFMEARSPKTNSQQRGAAPARAISPHAADTDMTIKQLATFLGAAVE